MIDLPKEPDAGLQREAIELVREAIAQAPELSKQGVSFDFDNALDLMVAVRTMRLLRQIRDEMSFLTREEKQRAFPMSMMNPLSGGGGTHE